ncbi:signal recognition particle-docking protein FtsY [Methanomethylophilus alvi]|uniref:signal recognition particle-docking protein FtsY n=1 Tax=Methanomethylophilus alvi TaxID=1291540 RepID=UPI0037DD371E
MFDSLKAKLKGIFKKGSTLDEESVYKKEEPKQEPVVSQTTEKETEVPEQQTVEPPKEVKAEPARKEEPLPVKKEPEPEEKPAKPVKGKGKRSSQMLSTSLLGKKIKDDPLDDILDELEVILLESDVAYDVVQEIILGVRNNLSGKKYSREYSLEEVVELAVKESVGDVLQVNEFDFDAWIEQQKRPTIIMFVGINGTGKTTAIAKIANRLKGEGKSVVLAACDTFRAGAIEQLTVHADRLDIKIVKSQQEADPASVAYDAIEHARSKMRDVVLIDTAGRMQTNNNLIAEMKKIAKVAKPDLKIFVGDALAGNDAIEQAKVFDEAIGVDAIILTKIDTDAKGGAALSIAKTIGKPIAFVCDGQEYEDISKFDADWMLERLFDQAEA